MEDKSNNQDIAKEKPVADLKKNSSNFITKAEKLIHFYYMIALVLVVILLAGGALLLLNIYSDNDISIQLEQRSAALRDKQDEVTKLRQVKSDYERLEESAQKILEILPEDQAQANLILDLEALAQRHNLVLNNLNIAEPKQTITSDKKNKQQVSSLILTVNLTGGDYFVMKSFLADLEKNVRIMDIQSLVYTPGTNSYDLTLATYYLKPE